MSPSSLPDGVALHERITRNGQLVYDGLMGMAQRSTVDPNLMIGYVRVSTDEQADSGLGLAAQRAAVTTEAEKRGWTLVAVYEDAESGKSLDRPGLAEALAAVEAGEAAGIVVAKLDRLSRSVERLRHLDGAGSEEEVESRRLRPRHRPFNTFWEVHRECDGLRCGVGTGHHRPANQGRTGGEASTGGEAWTTFGPPKRCRGANHCIEERWRGPIDDCSTTQRRGRSDGTRWSPMARFNGQGGRPGQWRRRVAPVGVDRLVTRGGPSGAACGSPRVTADGGSAPV